ncbi:MAG: sugar transferase [Oscillospiraceae bacterium]|nr:sugar transferase [Oscillospiraceae bacterium]
MQDLKSAEQAAAAEEKAVFACDIGYKEKPVYDVFKRLGDIVCSLLALILLSPLLIGVAAAIMIGDPGNPIYTQERTGKDSKTFIMYKFRSMRKGAEKERDSLLAQNEADGPIFKISDDPRVTKVGRFIRKTSIDELPQLVNIIKGDMSIIGPRPLPTYEQEKCNEYQQQRLLVKPGLSCFTALEKNSKDDFDHWIELDMKYIRERSVLTDIKIIIRTIGVVLKLNNN